MCLSTIAAEYNEPLQAAHAHIDDDRYVTGICGAATQPKLDLSDQLRSILAVIMCLCTIAAKYNVPLQAACANIDDDRCDMLEFVVVEKPTLDLSVQLRGCCIIFACAIYLSTQYVFVYYRR